MALVKAPKLNPIKPLPTAAPPPPESLTKDTYTHHTSPVNGPQAEVMAASKPGAKVRVTTDVPMHVTKHDADS